MVYINAIKACIHIRTNTHAHTHIGRQSNRWRKRSLRQPSEGQRVTREELRAVMTASRRRQDTKGSLVMGVNHEVLIRSKLKQA